MITGSVAFYRSPRKASLYLSLSRATLDRLTALRHDNKTGHWTAGAPSMASTAVAARNLAVAAQARRSVARFSRQGASSLARSYRESHRAALERVQMFAAPYGSNLPG